MSFSPVQIAAARRRLFSALRATPLLLIPCLAASPHKAAAQATAAAQTHAEEDGAVTPDATTNDSGPIGIVPLVHGFNASLISSSLHDSDSGWSSTLEPTLAYRFTPHLSLFGGTTAYAYVVIQDVVTNSRKRKTVTTTQQQPYRFVLGDTTVNGTYETRTHLVDYAATATLGIPTGDTSLGLGTGQVTSNVNNHLERTVTDWFTPEIELGIGDSQNLNDSRIRRNYIVTGKLAHFQAGASISLPLHLNLSTDTYEDLPLGPQTVTSTTGRGEKASQLADNTGNGIGEDNGFVNTLDLALTPHVTVSGIYNRSLRNNDDIAGFSLTFLLRATPKDTREASH